MAYLLLVTEEVVAAVEWLAQAPMSVPVVAVVEAAEEEAPV